MRFEYQKAGKKLAMRQETVTTVLHQKGFLTAKTACGFRQITSSDRRGMSPCVHALAALYLFPQCLHCIPGERRSSILLRQHAAPMSCRTRPGQSRHRSISTPRLAFPIPSPSPNRSLPQPTPASPLLGTGSQKQGLRNRRGEPSLVPGLCWYRQRRAAAHVQRSKELPCNACESGLRCLPYIPAQREIYTQLLFQLSLFLLKAIKPNQRRFNIPSPK